MLVTKYNVELDENRIPALVAENTNRYAFSATNTPELIVDMLNTLYAFNKKAEEYVYLICMTTKMVPCGVFEISHGNIEVSILGNREIFQRALLCGASKIVVAHNHPSGDANPSMEDLKTKEKIKAAADLMEVKLMDFIIVGDNYWSARETENL